MKQYIFTIEENCTGCNKCISVCPVDMANRVYMARDGSRKVMLDNNYCIQCGSCVVACNHNARDYLDDTERFFRDLSAQGGEPVSVAVAPALLTNFPEPEKLFGWLKSLGVEHIYDVSLGADIATWAMLKAAKAKNLHSLITQPCPPIVNYCEKYCPELIENLAPVQSPLICLAIFLRKYQGFTGKLAFLSPCIGKLQEIEDLETGGLVQYNVTFDKLWKKLETEGIRLEDYPPAGFEGMPSGIGHVYSRPGGLTETVRIVEPNLWIRQIDGTQRSFSYLREYLERKNANQVVPALVDILSCRGGCNLGSGTGKELHVDDIDWKTDRRKECKEKEQFIRTRDSVVYAPNDFFDRTLDWEDFTRNYADRNVYGFFEDEDLDTVFGMLKKKTPVSRKINCFACGYGSCQRMAQAIKRGVNIPESCIDFQRSEFKIDPLTSLLNRRELEKVMNRLIKWFRESRLHAGDEHRKQALQNMTLMMMDVDDFKGVNDRFGHDVGDIALREVAAAIVKSTRPTDAAGRWGGDEFMVILLNADHKEAEIVSGRIRKAVYESDVLPDGERFTTSIGIAEALETDDAATLFQRADQALYEAKKCKQIKTLR
ncbi:MAG: diguanylate cyclase [Acidaminococcaceae bacterium]|nr:diguanylate cyclase [Acidaminococcaceae bacterium]